MCVILKSLQTLLSYENSFTNEFQFEGYIIYWFDLGIFNVIADE